MPLSLVSPALGGVVVDAVGMQPLFWGGRTILAMTGALGLLLLGAYDFRKRPPHLLTL